MFVRIIKKWQKKKKKEREREKLLFYLLDNPTLEPNFK